MALVVVAKIPNDKVREHINESTDAFKMNERYKILKILSEKKYGVRHIYGDAIMANIIWHLDSQDCFRSVVEDRFYSIDANLKIDYNLKKLSENSMANSQYIRYWHGYIICLKPILIFFNIEQIYYINVVLSIGSTIYLMVLLWKSNLKEFIIAFIKRCKEDKINNFKEAYNFLVKASILWIIGYGGMYIAKWLVASIVLNESIIDVWNNYVKGNLLLRVNGEVLVADNGSTDKTVEIAKRLNARVINIKEKGYGNTLISGSKQARGEYTIMGDGDDSYNFLEIMPILEKLREGYDIVIGNRYKGNLEKGAMKFSHKYIGTPIISLLGRIKYRVNIRDFNCGLRGYVTQNQYFERLGNLLDIC